MRRRIQNRSLKKTHLKILLCIKELKELDIYTNNEGVFNVLKGYQLIDMQRFTNLSSFSTHPSITYRKVVIHTKYLINHSYLSFIYDEHNHSMYLALTIKGEEVLDKLKETKQLNFEKKTKRSIPCFVKIEKD